VYPVQAVKPRIPRLQHVWTVLLVWQVTTVHAILVCPAWLPVRPEYPVMSAVQVISASQVSLVSSAEPGTEYACCPMVPSVKRVQRPMSQ
jgi:hypothetical protein